MIHPLPRKPSTTSRYKSTSALNPRLVEEDNFPVNGKTSEQLKFLLNYAVLNPSIHKIQPWVFKIIDNAIELYANTRVLTTADPNYRELIISCGIALFDLRIAIRYFGYRDIVEVFPEPYNPNLKLLVTNPQSGLEEEDREMLDIAVTNTDRLIRLVNDILDLERIESGKVKILPQTCDAADLIHQAIEVMQPMANSQEITLVTEPISIPLLADGDRIHQTLTNLLSNAIKFSDPNSSVWVTVENQKREVLFKVSDRGRGIPPDKLELIFERFQQVDASDSRDKGGTGLGLTICYKIVEEHGGRIWAESEFGEGSTFYFTLPK